MERTKSENSNAVPGLYVTNNAWLLETAVLGDGRLVDPVTGRNSRFDHWFSPNCRDQTTQSRKALMMQVKR
jgi:hypothetical protein